LLYISVLRLLAEELLSWTLLEKFFLSARFGFIVKTIRMR
jgi:hypothetical protein